MLERDFPRYHRMHLSEHHVQDHQKLSVVMHTLKFYSQLATHRKEVQQNHHATFKINNGLKRNTLQTHSLRTNRNNQMKTIKTHRAISECYSRIQNLLVWNHRLREKYNLLRIRKQNRLTWRFWIGDECRLSLHFDN